MILIPPGELGPVDWRTTAAESSTFQPEFPLLVLPNANRMAIKLLTAMQAPPFLIEVDPAPGKIMVPQKVKLLIEWKLDVLGHVLAFSSADGDSAKPILDSQPATDLGSNSLAILGISNGAMRLAGQVLAPNDPPRAAKARRNFRRGLYGGRPARPKVC
jgi:hypothetical protein